MAKRSSAPVQLPGNTVITVVAKKGLENRVKDMPYSEALALRKKKSKYTFWFYQQGFCMVQPTDKDGKRLFFKNK